MQVQDIQEQADVTARGIKPLLNSQCQFSMANSQCHVPGPPGNYTGRQLFSEPSATTTALENRAALARGAWRVTGGMRPAGGRCACGFTAVVATSRVRFRDICICQWPCTSQFFPQLKSRRTPRKFAGTAARGVRLLAMAPARLSCTRASVT